MSKRKSAKFDSDGIDDLAQDKPVVYKLLNSKGENVYTGSSKKGQVGDRIKDHLPGGSDPIPGVKKVQIEPHSRIAEAQESEARIIFRSKPKHNKRGTYESIQAQIDYVITKNKELYQRLAG